jgi:shikimate 5-dehydrogenase
MSPILAGLVGAGIPTSLSPALHEVEGAALGLDYRYTILDLDHAGLAPADTGVMVRRAVAQGYTGLNITHPGKRFVLDELDHDVRILGAVNTVVVGNGRLIGHNTDHSVLAGLRHTVPDAPLERVVVVGAGGAGSAVAYALLCAGAGQVCVADVDSVRARELSARLNTFASGRWALGRRRRLPASRHRARAAGCAVADGGGMLVAQAAGHVQAHHRRRTPNSRGCALLQSHLGDLGW